MTRLPPPPDELAKKADVDRQFEAVAVRFDRLEQRFDSFEQRFDALEHRFERLEDRFDHMFEMMGRQWKNYTTVMVTAMTALTAIDSGILIAFVA
jgi:predicted nuclease with TOPRIM domain